MNTLLIKHSSYCGNNLSIFINKVKDIKKSKNKINLYMKHKDPKGFPWQWFRVHTWSLSAAVAECQILLNNDISQIKYYF